MKSYLKQHRQAPRKVRLTADAVRGKSVDRALAELKYTTRRASHIVAKLLKSAVSNAETIHGKKRENLIVKSIEVNEGPTLKRMFAMSKGRGFPINKRTSNIEIELGDKKGKK